MMKVSGSLGYFAYNFHYWASLIYPLSEQSLGEIFAQANFETLHPFSQERGCGWNVGTISRINHHPLAVYLSRLLVAQSILYIAIHLGRKCFGRTQPAIAGTINSLTRH